MRIIPAIDIIDGKCVRLSQGDYALKTVYNENPLEVAKMFEDAGIQHLHLVDLDGAKARKIVNRAVLETIASQTKLKVDFGGGISTEEQVRVALDAGAVQVTCGSIAAKDPLAFLQWLEIFGNEQLILGADAKDRMIAVAGWQESTESDVITFIQNYQSKGIEFCICTDIAKDGMLQGPAFELYQEILAGCPGLNLIASGGVTTIEDIDRLTAEGLEGAIVGKAIYEGRITLQELAARC
jgi:phosphoribosylformimino-5-aminoimidazole carboxamide ribotide isomerase